MKTSMKLILAILILQGAQAFAFSCFVSGNAQGEIKNLKSSAKFYLHKATQPDDAEEVLVLGPRIGLGESVVCNEDKPITCQLNDFPFMLMKNGKDMQLILRKSQLAIVEDDDSASLSLMVDSASKDHVMNLKSVDESECKNAFAPSPKEKSKK